MDSPGSLRKQQSQDENTPCRSPGRLSAHMLCSSSGLLHFQSPRRFRLILYSPLQCAPLHPTPAVTPSRQPLAQVRLHVPPLVFITLTLLSRPIELFVCYLCILCKLSGCLPTFLLSQTLFSVCRESGTDSHDRQPPHINKKHTHLMQLDMMVSVKKERRRRQGGI